MATVVGLDLGSSGVRAMQFRFNRSGRATPTRLVTAPLPRGAMEDGEVRDVDTVSEVLRDLWGRHRGLPKQVRFALANSGVMVRQMDVEWMEPDQFRRDLPFLVADHLPVDVDEMNLDYHVLGEYDQPGEDGSPPVRMRRVLLVAAHTGMVDTVVTTLRRAGLMPVHADLVPFALIRATPPVAGEPDTAEAVVDIGSDVTVIAVHQAGQPRFVRIVTGRAGRAVTDGLVDAFGWTVEEAEATKLRLGLPVTTPTPVGTGPGESVFGGWAEQPAPTPGDDPAQPVIEEQFSGVIAEVRSSLDFVLSTTDDITGLSRVVLAGGTALTSGLVPRLASELRVPVELAAPLRAVPALKRPGGGSPVPEPLLSVVVGLGLGA